MMSLPTMDSFLLPNDIEQSLSDQSLIVSSEINALEKIDVQEKPTEPEMNGLDIEFFETSFDFNCRENKASFTNKQINLTNQQIDEVSQLTQ